MDFCVDERDFKAISQDRYTFAVLSRILHGACDLVMTDHERFILCHSAASFPVWLWTNDNMSAAEKKSAWEIAMAARSFKDGYRYNLKYELAEYFLARAQQEGVPAKIMVNMFAYDCPVAIKPAHRADGGLFCGTEADAEEAAVLMRRFYDDIHQKEPDEMTMLKRAREHIEDGRFYMWKNDAGKTVACCYYRPDGDLASISGVYTVPEYRRQHYAQNMVYEVSKIIADQNLTPMLYTDADYAASNACYEKVGYKLRGKLCTIGV